MRDGPPPAYASSPMRSMSPMRSGSPMRGSAEYSSTSTLLQEITTLRARLRDLEDDNKSSVVSSTVDDKDSPLVTMLRKDAAQLEQEKALQEKDFLNQMSSLQVDHQQQLTELQEKIKTKDELNIIINDKLRVFALEKDGRAEELAAATNENNKLRDQLKESIVLVDDLKEKLCKARKDGEAIRSKTDTEEKYTRLLEDQRESHVKEIEQMKANLASADLEIAESRGELDQLQAEVDELQTYREALLEEVTTVRLNLSDEKRISQSLKAELGETKNKVEKLQHQMKEMDIRLDQKVDEIKQLKKIVVGSPEEVQQLQADIMEMDETMSQQKDQIDEMHGVIHDFESKNESLMSEVADMRQQMHGLSSKPLTIDTVASSDDDDDKPISPAEKDQLVKDMLGLEARLVRFHTKLADKECTIDDLNAFLSEERKANKQLRKEMKQLKADSDGPARRIDHFLSAGAGDTRSEFALLRKQNKALIEEVQILRKTRAGSEMTHRRVQSANLGRHASSTKTSLVGRNKPLPPPLAMPPSVNRTLAVENRLESPRTPVSGLVATFERGIGTKNVAHASPITEVDGITQTPCLPGALESVDVAELQDLLRSEKQVVVDLQTKLRIDMEMIQDLQKKLRAEKKIVIDFQSSMSRANGSSPTSLVSELRESHREIERLEAKLNETATPRSKRDAISVKERAELNKLRSDAVYASMEREDYEKKIKDDALEIDELRTQLARAVEKASFHDEKKDDFDQNAVAELQAVLAEKEEALECLRAKYETYEDETEEQLERLRSQVVALQSELEGALTKIGELESELQDEHSDRNVPDKEKRALEQEIETMELKLNVARASFCDRVNEHTDEIKLLEGKIVDLEMTNVELLKEVPADVQKEFDDEAMKLTTELTTCQAKMADLEIEYSIKFKDLENRIRSLEVELEEVRKEKESLQKHLDSSEAAATDSPVMEKKLNAEINRLSLALTEAQMGRANVERENLEKLKFLEDEVEALELEATAELDRKNEEINAIKSTLVRKEEDILRLEQEKTQLCASMNDVSHSRKDDMEELQAELLDMTTQTRTQAREIQMLKMRVEEHETRKADANAVSQRRIRELEQEIQEISNVSRKTDERDGVPLLKNENAQLRESIRDVKIERRQLKERLDSLTQEKCASRSSQVLRDRNSLLKDEVEKLTKRLKKLESSITRFAI